MNVGQERVLLAVRVEVTNCFELATMTKVVAAATCKG